MDWMKAGIVAGDMKLELALTKAGTYGTNYVRARSSPPSASAPTDRRTRYIRPRKADITAKYSGEKEVH